MTSSSIDTTSPSAPTSLTTIFSTSYAGQQAITGLAEAGSTVKLYNGSTLLGSAIANSNSTFSITFFINIQGNYSLTATATDAAGNVSESSSGGRLHNVLCPVYKYNAEQQGIFT